MHVLEDASVPKLKEHIGGYVFPLFQDVGALGYSSSCTGLQSLPDKLWAVERVLLSISMFGTFGRELPNKSTS